MNVRWLAVVVVVGSGLACSGMTDMVPTPDVEAPEVEAPTPAPVAANPLVMEKTYFFEKTATSKPEDASASYVFHADGTLDYENVSYYDGTWTASAAPSGVWTVEITGWTSGTDPEGGKIEKIELPVGQKLEVSGDGQRLTVDGQPFALATDGAPGGDGGAGGEAGGGGGGGGDGERAGKAGKGGKAGKAGKAKAD
jgi:hypothetical protein